MNPIEIQLDFLKREFDSLNDNIARFDNITQSTKNWAIVLWTASISFSMSQKEGLRDYVIFTTIIPLAFWYIDARWRQIQRQMIFRVNELSDFLNSENLQKSIDIGKITGFILLDARSKKSNNKLEKTEFSSLKRTMLFKTVSIFYIFQIVASLITGITTIFNDKI